MSKKELLVSAIENGTVIDHIPTEKTFQVVNLLHLQDMDTPVTIGYNFKSGLMDRKGIIKISDKFFTDDEINRLSVVAPNIVLNTIRNYEVVEKKRVETPDEASWHHQMQQPQVHHQQRAYGDDLQCHRQGAGHRKVPLLRQGTED